MIREIVLAQDMVSSLRWLQRWVSGSMRDPEWNMKGAGTVEDAFSYLSQFSKTKPKELWRFIAGSKKLVNSIAQTKMLPVSKNSVFQSFTVSRKLAIQEGQNIHGSSMEASCVVCANVPEKQIMIALEDFYKSKNPQIKEYMAALDLWEHQKEVIVKIAKPIKLKTVEIL